MQPHKQTGASVTVQLHGLRRVAVATQPLQEALEEAEVLIQFAGGLDPARPFKEADKPHEAGRSATLAPATQPHRRRPRATVAVVPEKVMDHGAVNRFQRDTAKALKPDQEVTGRVAIAINIGLGNPFTKKELVDKTEHGWVETGPCGDRPGPASGY